MTEVPDFLLQRSRDRRRALGLPVADDGSDSGSSGDTPTTAAATVATASATVLSPVDAKGLAKPAPESPEVVAENARKKPPTYASIALIALPLWAFLYVALLGDTVVEQIGALAVGETVYQGKCASCHGANGDGGVGPSFQDGEILLTFSEFEDHLEFVEVGGVGSKGDAYGDADRPGGQRIVEVGGMPPFASTLTPAELYAVTRYEREILGGEELSAEELAERDEHFEELGGGDHG